MDKQILIHTMEFYLAIKRNEPSSHKKLWRKFKSLFQSERSQPEKVTYCMIPVWTLWKR